MKLRYISRPAAAFALAAALLSVVVPPVSACTGGMVNSSVSGTWYTQGSCSSPDTYRAQTVINFKWVDASPRSANCRGTVQ